MVAFKGMLHGTFYSNIACLHAKPLLMLHLGSQPLSLFMADHYRALEVMKEEWVGGEMRFSSTIDWVNDFRETLTKLHEIACRKELDTRPKSRRNMTRGQSLGNMKQVR